MNDCADADYAGEFVCILEERTNTISLGELDSGETLILNEIGTRSLMCLNYAVHVIK